MAVLKETEQLYRTPKRQANRNKIICFVCILIMLLCIGLDVYFIKGIMAYIF